MNKSSTAPRATVQDTVAPGAHHDYQLTPDNPQHCVARNQLPRASGVRPLTRVIPLILAIRRIRCSVTSTSATQKHYA